MRYSSSEFDNESTLMLRTVIDTVDSTLRPFIEKR